MCDHFASVLTREDVRRIAREEGLDEFADSLVGRVRPGWRLDLCDGAVPPAGALKIGGDPDLAPGETWPTNHRGIPMTFLAQVNCDELPAIDDDWLALAPRASAGLLLRVFGDLVDNPFEPGPARVLTTSSTVDLVRTPAPSIPTPWPAGGQWDDLGSGERVRELPQASVRPAAFLTAPETHPVLSPETGVSEPSADRYYAWANRLRVDGRDYNTGPLVEPLPWEVHHFLGEAASVQDDVRYYGEMLFKDARIAAFLGYEPAEELANASAWQTLLSLHDDARFGLRILDGGAYTVLIPSADLRADAYHRTVCTVDSS